MVIKNVSLDIVCGITSKLPDTNSPEVAFAGKSNVGKSSLINGLMNRKSLARTSAQPGKTQTINFYNINEAMYLVDLPGYGYAKVSQSEKEKWGKMIERYLHTSKNLKAVFLLIDIRHDPSANDKMMYDWILNNGYEPIIIATKLDKLKRSQIQKNIKAIKEGLKLSKDGIIIPFSAETKQGRDEIWALIDELTGLAATEDEPMVAVVRCNGSCANRPRINQYDGAKSCAIAASLYGGETGCSYGCLGCGDCVAACQFDAIHMNPETGLPEVDEAKCTACGACVKACPKAIIEIRPQGKKSRRVYISCVNKDKGAVARKACTVSCIGCGKCVKTCPFEAITLENNLAYIDPDKCKSCRKCVEVCPQNTIIELNFPPRKPKEEAPAAPKPAAVSKEAVETPAPAAKVETPAEKATEAPKVTE